MNLLRSGKLSSHYLMGPIVLRWCFIHQHFPNRNSGQSNSDQIPFPSRSRSLTFQVTSTVERGYCHSSIYSKRSCDELIRLAAFTILYGHLFNPSNVAGLDVLVGRDAEEPKFLEESDLNILRGDFKTFDADVAKRFSTNLSNLDNYR